MKTLTIFIFSLFLASCAASKKQEYVTVIGEAVNFKLGAAVISNEDGKRYFLEGVRSWDDSISSWTKGGPRSQISVSGYVEVTERKRIPGTQQMVGIRRTILNPFWKVITKDSITD